MNVKLDSAFWFVIMDYMRIIVTTLLLGAFSRYGVGYANSSNISSRELRGAIFALMSGQHTPSLSSQFMRKAREIVGGTEIMVELEKLLEGGNFQEAIWRLQEVDYVDQAARLEQLLTDVLEHENIVDINTQVRSLGYNLLHVVRFTNGVLGVFKHSLIEENVGREIAAYRFDKLLGLNVFPLTVSRKLDDNDIIRKLDVGIGRIGAMQLFMPRAADANEIAELIAIKRSLSVSEDGLAFALARAVSDMHSDYPAKDTYKSFVPLIPKKIRMLKFLTLDNDDIHGGNYMFPMQGRSFAIDGGNAFAVDTHPDVEKAHIDSLRKHPQDYFSDADFLAELEKITLEQIEATLLPVLAEHTESDDTDMLKEICMSIKERIDLYVSIVGEEVKYGTH